MEERNKQKLEKLSYEDLETVAIQAQQSFEQVQNQLELYKKQLETITNVNSHLKEQLRIISQDMSFKAIEVTFKVLDEKYRNLFPQSFINSLIDNIMNLLTSNEEDAPEDRKK